MSRGDDGFFSVLTPPGRGGIAVLRIVGSVAARALETAFRPAGRGNDGNLKSPDSASSTTLLPEPGRLAYGHIIDGEGAPLDEIILYRADPKVFEVNCHGGPAAVEAVCRRLAGLGLEKVSPDRLLELEGASQIERDARRMLWSARTPLAARILLDQLNGALKRAIEEACKSIASGRADEASARLDALLNRWRCCGRLLARPARIAVAGPPNVGKSTLVNRLLGADRVITSEAPGTTRDYVEAEAALSGLPVVLVDTAGLRETEEMIEREGVERARREAGAAEVVVYLLDASEGLRAEDGAMLASLGERGLAVWNKADLAGGPLGEPGAIAISALTGAGVDVLTQALLNRLGYRPGEPGEAVPFTSVQAETFEAAREALAAGRTKGALETLGKLTNTSSSGDRCPAT